MESVSVDPFLVIVTLITSILLIAVNIYILVYFQHPEDKNAAYFPKALVVFGLTFVEASVLLLPLDVANKGGLVGCFDQGGWNTLCGGMRLEVVWQIVYFSILIFVVVLIPFAIFYYEADDGLGNQRESQWWNAVKYVIGTFVIVVVTIIILHQYLGEADIPLDSHFYPESFMMNITTKNNLTIIPEICPQNSCTFSKSSLIMTISVPIYAVALMGFVGWFFFVLYGGIGIFAFPLDMINAYIYRPRYMPSDIYAERKIAIGKRAVELIEVGRMIEKERKELRDSDLSSRQRRKRAKMDTVTTNKFKQMVYVLERDLEELKLCGPEFRNHNPLVPYAKLLIGIIGIVLSLCWILHIALYMLPKTPIGAFLNDYLIALDKSVFPFFGTITVGVFAMYLLACTIKGNFKFGMRFFLIKIHPMKYGGTMINSFLFNLALIMICSVPVVQFSTDAFREYARLTDIDVIFSAQIKNLKFFKYFWENNIFIIAMCVITFLSLIYLIIKPSDDPADAQEMRNRIERIKNAREEHV